VSDLPWYFPDVMPTLAELAGAPEVAPKGMDGVSIVPTLMDKGAQKRHEYLYWAQGSGRPGTQAVRMGRYKGIGTAEKVKVYDLNTDISEQKDLAGTLPEVAEKMRNIMAKAWLEPRSQQDDGKYMGEKHPK